VGYPCLAAGLCARIKTVIVQLVSHSRRSLSWFLPWRERGEIVLVGTDIASRPMGSARDRGGNIGAKPLRYVDCFFTGYGE